MEETKTLTYIPLEEIEENGKLLKEIGYKSYVASITLLISGIIIFLAKGTMFKVFGVLCVLLALGYVFLIKDTIIVRLYDDAVVFINAEEQTGLRVDYNEVAEWNLKNDAVNVIRNDGLVVRAETPVSYRATGVLRKYMPDRETRVKNEDKRIDVTEIFRKNKGQ